MMFLKISQNSQENICVRISFFCKFIKKEILGQMFSCQFCDISKNIFYTEHLRKTASNIVKAAETVLWSMFQNID